jgi:hypothetical protein
MVLRNGLVFRSSMRGQGGGGGGKNKHGIMVMLVTSRFKIETNICLLHSYGNLYFWLHKYFITFLLSMYN